MSDTPPLFDPRTEDPEKLWDEVLSKERVHLPVKTLPLDEPIYPDKVRFVCVSDTHEKLGEILGRIPNGDVLLHCGDFTDMGNEYPTVKFNHQMGTLPHKYKVVIAGNHELGFEDPAEEDTTGSDAPIQGTKQGYKLLSNCIYLHGKSIEIYGIKLYGASWHPYAGPAWIPHSFHRCRGKPILSEWLKIPPSTDVLMTHIPPLGHLDLNSKGQRMGCADLLNCVEKLVKPKFHVFGHIHNQNGATTNGETTFINAAICNDYLDPVQNPIIFDIPLPKGWKKE